MMYDIATGVQDTLEDIALNKMVDKSVPSLDVERAQKALEEQKRHEEEEARERQKIEQEEAEKEKLLYAEIEKELKRKREQQQETHEKRRLSTIMTDDAQTTDTEDCIVFDRAIKINGPEGLSVFRKVCGMVKIAQGPLMTVYTARPAFPLHEQKNLPLVLKQLQLPDSFPESPEAKREIQNLEQEMDSLRSLKHANIIQLYESKVTREGSPQSSRERPKHGHTGNWTISVLTEYANRGSLRDLLETVESVSPSTARVWTISLLEGLDHIHRSGAVHSGIHVGNILLSRSPGGNYPVPKFGDISYTPSLYKLMGKPRSAMGPENWLPPEFARSSSSSWNTTRKSDIWNFGVVFLQIIFGLRVIKDYESPEKLMDSVHLTGSLYDFLESIFKPEPKDRPTPFELLPSEFLRSDDPIILTPSPRARSPELKRMSWSYPGSSHSRSRRGSMPTPVPAVSRYATDFIELGQLGKGGYGRVVKARNKLDGQDYAIKIIRQKKASKMTSSLGEVMLLSRLTHSYLVRYFQAWVEDGADSPKGSGDEEDMTETSATGTETGTRSGALKSTDSGDEDSDSEEVTGFETTTGGLDLISSGAGYSSVQFGYDSDVFESGSEESSEDSDEDEDESSEEESDEEDSSTTDAKGKSKTISISKSSRSPRNMKKVKKNDESRKQTLYIQMSLAERQVGSGYALDTRLLTSW